MRFKLEEHQERATGRKWWSLIDTGWIGGSRKHEQVGVNFTDLKRAEMVRDAFNLEWNTFERDPW